MSAYCQSLGNNVALYCVINLTAMMMMMIAGLFSFPVCANDVKTWKITWTFDSLVLSHSTVECRLIMLISHSPAHSFYFFYNYSRSSVSLRGH